MLFKVLSESTTFCHLDGTPLDDDDGGHIVRDDLPAVWPPVEDVWDDVDRVTAGAPVDFPLDHLHVTFEESMDDERWRRHIREWLLRTHVRPAMSSLDGGEVHTSYHITWRLGILEKVRFVILWRGSRQPEVVVFSPPAVAYLMNDRGDTVTRY